MAPESILLFVLDHTTKRVVCGLATLGRRDITFSIDCAVGESAHRGGIKVRERINAPVWVSHLGRRLEDEATWRRLAVISVIRVNRIVARCYVLIDLIDPLVRIAPIMG